MYALHGRSQHTCRHLQVSQTVAQLSNSCCSTHSRVLRIQLFQYTYSDCRGIAGCVAAGHESSRLSELQGSISLLCRQPPGTARTSVLPTPRSLEQLSCIATFRSSAPCKQVVMPCKCVGDAFYSKRSLQQGPQHILQMYIEIAGSV